jgi:hypothetical protein
MADANEDLFNFMKHLGHFKEYSDYQDYRKRKLGIAQEPADSFSEFKKELSEEELEEFNFMFEDEDGK